MWYLWFRIKTNQYTWLLVILINMITAALWASLGYYLVIVPHGIFAIIALSNYDYYHALKKAQEESKRYFDVEFE